MKNYKIVYTTGPFQYMIDDLRHSILSARRWLDKEDIIVMFTPPYKKETVDYFNKIATVVVHEKNLTEPFKMHPTDGCEPKRFGDKLYLCDIDFPNLMFIGCDTIVYNDPSRLFDDDYDFGSTPIERPICWTNIPWQVIRDVLYKTRQRYNIPPEYSAHLWNSDHILFKNYTHRKIKDTWLKYFNDKEGLIHINEKRRTDDQLSLTPTLYEFPDLKIKCFGKEDIFKIGWNKELWMVQEFPKETCIIHGDGVAETLGMEEELSQIEDELLNGQDR